jgi:transposase
MRWLHNILHWRCDRELAQREAMLAALMPRYQPVVTPSEPLAATIQRQAAREEIEAEERLETEPARDQAFRWGQRFVEAEK